MDITFMRNLAFNWYGPAIESGHRPIRLISKTKQCPSGTWEDNILNTPREVMEAFEGDFNVGFLLQGKQGACPNPNGTWVLDIDSQKALDKFGDASFNLMVSRNHPAKRHLYARLPDPSTERHSRLVRNSHDVKLTGIVVGPGSRHKDGGIYQPFKRNPVSNLWEPWDGTVIDWNSLPVMDPTPYIPPPKLVMLSPDKALRLKNFVKEEWLFKQETSVSQGIEQPFLTATGDSEDRRIRGDQYIKNRIKCKIFSRSGRGGRGTLLAITIHLIRYLRLPDSVALEMLNKPVYGMLRSWNAQCVWDDTGDPYPWSEAELKSAIDAAYHYVPAYGIIKYEEAKCLQAVQERLVDFWTLVDFIPTQGEVESMAAQEVYRTFMDMYSVSPADCSYRRFTVAMQRAISTGLIRLMNKRGGGRKKLRYYGGISPELLELASILRSETENEGLEVA